MDSFNPFLMNAPNSSKSAPEVKPWVRRVVEASGVEVPPTDRGEATLVWWGVEMARFLADTTPLQVPFTDAMLDVY